LEAGAVVIARLQDKAASEFSIVAPCYIVTTTINVNIKVIGILEYHIEF
jgi:hypothetical protein